MPNSAWPGFAQFGEGLLRALRPAERKLHRRFGLVMGRGKRRAFIEHHLDVGTEQALHLDGALRRQRHAGAVEMGLEGDAVFVELSQLGQRHDLIAAGIGEDRAVPVHETMQSPELGDALGAGAEHQMIGVGENDVGAGLAHVLGEHGLHRRAGADRHEGRRADGPTRCRDLAGPCCAIASLFTVKRKADIRRLSGLSKQASP